MLVGFLTLLVCELLGELLRSALHLPIPGPVIGMLLLATGLALLGDKKRKPETPASSSLDRVAAALLRHMGLLFVPAGVGIIAEIGVLRQEWLPILAGVIGSTVLSLAATAFSMHRLARIKARPARFPPGGVRTDAVP